MANSVNMTSKNAAGKEVTKIITDVNPAAADSDISNFVVALASLSNNTLTSIQKVVKENITLSKTVTGNASANSITSQDYGATINALAGNDTIIVNGAVANSINAGVGNDIISLAGGTSKMTVYGGAGYDTIFADNDFRTYGKDTVYSGHLYQFGADDNKDTIVGFNENDTIQITTPGAAVITQWDSTSNHYIVSISGASAHIQLNNYGGGKRLNVIDSNGALVSVGAAENGYYIVPRIKQGTTASDINNPIINVAENDNFSVDGLMGSDVIINQGANNVTIYGGDGNDTIQLTTGTVDGSLKYGVGTVIDAGAGSDIIIGESVEGGVADSNAKPRTFIFGGNSGFDTIYYLGANDSIQLRDSTYILAASVDGADLTLNFASYEGATKPSASMTLKDFIKSEEDKDTKTVTVFDADGNPQKISIPKYILGTSNAETLENHNDYYSILADSGNDTIYNTGDNVTIYGEGGDDVIYNSGDYVAILPGFQNDTLYNSGSFDTVYFGIADGNNYISDTGTHNTFGYPTRYTQVYLLAVDSSDSLDIQGGVISNIYSTNNNTIIAVQDEGTNGTVSVSVGGGNFPHLIYKGQQAILADSAPLLCETNDTVIACTESDNQITLTGSNILTFGGGGNDFVSLGGNAANCTIHSGSGYNTVNSNGNGNFFVLENATINNFNTDNDVIITNGSVVSSAVTENGVRLTEGTNSVLLYNVSSGNIKTVYQDYPVVEYPLDSNIFTAENSNDSVMIHANFDKACHIYNAGDYASIVTGQGDDSIYNAGDSVYISLGSGDDFISLGGTANNCTVYAYEGNYNIANNGQGNVFRVTYNKNSNSTVTGFNIDKDYVAVSNTNTTITGATVDSNTTLTFNYSSYTQNVFLPGVSSGIIKLKLGSKNGAYLMDSNAVVSHYNDSPSEKVSGSSSADVFYNLAPYATLDCGNGNDTVYNFGDNVSINGGNGDDFISLGSNAANCTIFGAAGNDNIVSNGKGNVFYFRGSTAEGTNTISGFSVANDTIMVGYTGTTITSAVAGSDTTLTLKQSSRTTTVLLPGVSSGNIKVRASLEGGAAGLFTISDGATVRVGNLSGGW